MSPSSSIITETLSIQSIQDDVAQQNTPDTHRGSNNNNTAKKTDTKGYQLVSEAVNVQPLTHENPMPDWPKEPARLQLGVRSRLQRAAVEILLTLFPVCFAVLGFLVISINRAHQSSFGDSILQATKVAPTIWPLAFAAIVGGMMKNLAHWRTQRGEKLGLIEQLMGSQTVFGTLFMVWSLRAKTFITPMLIALWMMSPFGGQAILRSVQVVLATKKTAAPLTYLIRNPKLTYEFDNSRVYLGSVSSLCQSMYGTALLSTPASLHELEKTTDQEEYEKAIASLGGSDAAIELSRRDVWNHARIPIIDLLPNFDKDGFSGDQWFDVPDDRILSYTSAFGVSLSGFPSQKRGNISLSVEYAYTRFRCDEWKIGNDFEEQYRREEPSFKISHIVNGKEVAVENTNATHQFQSTVPFDGLKWKSGADQQVPEFFGQRCSIPERPLLFYTSWITNASNLDQSCFDESAEPYGTTCYPRTIYVEADLGCSRVVEDGAFQCETRRLRRSQNEQNLCPNVTDIDVLYKLARQYMNSNSTYDTLNGMMSALKEDSKPYCSPSITEQFLLSPVHVVNTDFFQDPKPLSGWNLTQIAPAIFASRLTMLYNTWSMATKAFGYLPVKSSAAAWEPGKQLLANASSVVWEYEEGKIYQVHTAWITMYMASVFTLLTCALFAVYAKYQLEIPEILGNVSSLTRDTPYVGLSVPMAASTKSGTERAMLMKDVFVRVKDVKVEEEVGRLALSLCVSNKMDRIPLDKGKLYE